MINFARRAAVIALTVVYGASAALGAQPITQWTSSNGVISIPGHTGDHFSASQLAGATGDGMLRTPTGASNSRSFAAAAADVLQGADNGIVCDGATDIGPALQTLANRVSIATSPEIQLPYGICIWNTAVTSTRTVHVRGHRWSENAELNTTSGTFGSTGTILKTTNSSIVPLTISQTGADGSSLDDVAIVQAQPLPTTTTLTGTTASGSATITAASAAPAVGVVITGTGVPTGSVVTAVSGSAPSVTITLNNTATASGSGVSLTYGQFTPTVYQEFVHVSASDGFKANNVLCSPCYDAFYLDDSARAQISSIDGEILKSAVRYDNNADINRVWNVNKWVYWLKYLDTQCNCTTYDASQPAGSAVLAYEQNNLDLISMGRQDGAFVDGVFCFGCRSSLRLFTGTGGVPGVATGVEIGRLDCDSTVHCLYVNGATNTSVKYGEINSFGQLGAFGGTAAVGANTVYVDTGGQIFLQGGPIASGAQDQHVVEFDSTTLPSTLSIDSVRLYSSVAGASKSVVYAAGTGTGIAPHNVRVRDPIYNQVGVFPALNFATTNADAVIKGEELQLLVQPNSSNYCGGGLWGIADAQPMLSFISTDAATCSQLKVQMPPWPYQGMEVVISTNFAVTTLTLTDPNGYGFYGVPASLSANQPIRFKWLNTGTSIQWVRI